MEKPKTLQEQILHNNFHPEIYVYPTPRMLSPSENLDISSARFTTDLNIYVHIPFCRQICSYCGYLKTADSSSNLKKEYIDSVILEIKSYSEILKDKTIKTIHIGGGTPSLLAPSEIERIIQAITSANPNALETADEISIEATPESIELEKFLQYRALGINRVSIGVQSLDDSEIILARRKNTSKITLQAIEILRQAQIPNLVCDLMIGILGQSVESFEKSVGTLLKLAPETVELYALGMMPNTKINTQRNELMENKDIYRCYEIGREAFLNAGYIQDCHNRYILPRKGSFLQEDNVFSGMSLIGIGAGVRTYATNTHYRNAYQPNAILAIQEYMQKINAGQAAITSSFWLDPIEKMHQFVIYHIEELDLDKFKESFGISFEDKFSQLYSELLQLDLTIENKRTLKLTPKGLLYRDLIARNLFSPQVAEAEHKYRGV